MTSFGWKRKIGEKVSRSVSTVFQPDETDEDNFDDEVDWLTLAPKRSLILEDAVIKSARLKEEGTTLCEAERYWEAIKIWSEAIQLTPYDARLHEMKAQALLILHEVFPAVQFAEKATRLQPNWWSAFQTLGRALLGLGEVHLAVRAFSKAVHLNPCVQELWEDDLKWACTLLDQKEHITTELEKNTNTNSNVREILSEEDDDDDEDDNNTIKDINDINSKPIKSVQISAMSLAEVKKLKNSSSGSSTTTTTTTITTTTTAATTTTTKKTIITLPSNYVMMR
ncbi:tetratricopeptide repeat protein 33 [Octopus sinensis]|uniref:Tetratricopeptide repeat protein 33 n=1 Tax=Octopus sinensis TaxID=2607531 RepID=A0A6P7SN39_9MOLL|nr:tetratricopeptide repeat protein 33 [Octopus sinensis]